MHKKIIIGLICAIIALCTATFDMTLNNEYWVKNTFADTEVPPPPIIENKKPAYSEYANEDMGMIGKRFAFKDGGAFNIERYDFNKMLKYKDLKSNVVGDDGITYMDGKIVKMIPIAGDNIKIRWQEYSDDPNVESGWIMTQNITRLPKATLFVETSLECAIISLPALYSNKVEHNTIEALNSQTLPLKVKYVDGGYVLLAEYNPIMDSVGEIWYYKTVSEFFSWNQELAKRWLPHDLYKNRRFCIDGYYYGTYDSYRPYSVNGFFRNPANFSGGALIRSELNQSDRNIGYAMTKICADNINDYGFWETGPKSTWLEEDYGIGYDFYDTRFSTDFAISLIDGYKYFDDFDLLGAAITYGDFLMNFALNEGYRIKGPTEGILVPDYWSKNQKKKTHVSLNHHINEMNFLLDLYDVTDEERYYEMFLAMYHGVKNTLDDWILEDGNLKYALMYEQSTNLMQDYPFLTYNDLWFLRQKMNTHGLDTAEIQKLMDSKKKWMDQNDIKSYLH